MNENTARARETFDKMTATGTETVQSLQQGLHRPLRTPVI